ncbi:MULTISPECIES: aspartate carbamoyltransferase regulatory subunit [Halococcus]|uniref:Aspartate carbamoyltransferase regulatory chain n=1 Tax=Halococcus salifodinae DSM 8989 TaxID=1227456 RepID=M0MXP7_9EURY|nr:MULTISPECIES: aspartate carbamoyltransferase regulatory subunit [Halococcus]EMA50078.1 aspartate carbamoyltransferase regulatory subunit [Halococcus salifodinae DSM 8989]
MSERDDHELRISKIENGTVIDHIAGGHAPDVLAILGIGSSTDEVVSVGMNVPSDRLGHKDVVKIEGRELSQDEVDVISLIAPAASINIIREYGVAEKHRVERPAVVEGVLSCPNHDCITTDGEPVTSRFEVLDDGVRCAYCETILRENLTEHIDV